MIASENSMELHCIDTYLTIFCISYHKVALTQEELAKVISETKAELRYLFGQLAQETLVLDCIYLWLHYVLFQ